jgi:hypothetical protein
VDAFLFWLETSTLGQAVRAAGPWAYAVINLFHILGVAALFGAVLMLDLRLLGLWRRAPLAALADATVPMARLGFVVAAAAGVGMLATNGTDYVGNPFLLIKFPAIALGLVNVAVLSRLTAWRTRGTREPSPRDATQLALAGGISLVCWLTAITAGRLIAYW